jgi:hypothetical protein
MYEYGNDCSVLCIPRHTQRLTYIHRHGCGLFNHTYLYILIQVYVLAHMDSYTSTSVYLKMLKECGVPVFIGLLVRRQNSGTALPADMNVSCQTA